MERSLIFIKPDGVERGLAGEILSRFEKRQIKINRLELRQPTESLVETHYQEHIDKPFFPRLKEYILSGPIIVIVLEAENVVKIVRDMVGSTNPADAAPGTIRADYGLTTAFNLIHASDSPESAEREIKLFFGS